MALPALADQVVSGQVIEASTGEPLIGATVQPVGGGNGTATDVNGEFNLKVPDNVKILTVSYVGLTTQEVKVGTGLKIALDDAGLALDEVVVTALGIKRQSKALGYSATQVNGDEITSTRTSDVMSSLAGKVAGVSISESASGPSSSKSVIIRGVSSLAGNNQPLYVVDGVPLENNANYSTDGLNSGFDFGNGASVVNPDDVESMTILKGAAATALYGSRAGAGVILITTKKGIKQPNGIGIEYNGGLAWETLLRIPQMQNEFGQGWYGMKTDDENGSWGPRFDGSLLRYGTVYNNSQQMKSYVPIENNVKDFFDTGFRYSNSLSYNGATDKSSYYLSFSHVKDNGIIPTDADSYKRLTFALRASHTVGNVTLSANANYAYQKSSDVMTGQGQGSMYNCIMQTPRDISIAELKDLSNPFNTPGYYYTPYGVTNPYWILENYQNDMESERFYGNIQADYNFLKKFTLTYRIGLDTRTNHRDYGEPNMASLFYGTYNYYQSSSISTATGQVSQSIARRREIDQNVMLTYDDQYGDDWHLNATLGFNGNERRYRSLGASVTNLTIPTWYDLSNSAEIPTVSQYSWKRRYMGAYLTAEGAYKDMLYLTVNARNDWSSTLPSGHRSYFYPGVTVSWLFHQLLSPEARNTISFGKLRAAWGRTGNDASVYMTNSVYAQAGATSSGWGSSSFPFTKTGTNAYSVGNTLGNQELSPEMTTEFEVGLQMAFFQNRFSFDFTYYNRNTDKQIFSLEMDPATGYNYQNINLGKIRNRGIELLVSVTPVKLRDFQWDVTWNFTKNKSKVISLPAELTNEETGVAESIIYGLSGGTGLYAIEGEELGMFKAYVPQYIDGKIVVDENGLPLVNSEQQIIGSMNHKWSMGFGTTLRYKSVSLNAALDWRKGGIMYSRTKDITYFTGNAIQTAYNDRNPFIIPNSVYADGTENTTPLTATNIYNYWNDGGDLLDAAFLIDKSYVKLRTVSLNWDLPAKWLAKTFIRGITLSVYGNNLFLWTPSSNTFVDPEVSSFGNDLSGNYGEYSANPSCRKFGFNVKVKF